VGFLALLPSFGTALELAPWFAKPFEVVPSATYRFCSSSSIAGQNGAFYKPLHGNFYGLDALLPICKWCENSDCNWCAQAELLMADTTYRAFGIDNLSATLRYQLLDDNALVDSVALVPGATLSVASKAALQDFSSFHHGRLELLLHLAVGRQWSDYAPFWSSRCWGAGGLGISDVGSPWLQGVFCLEKNFLDIHRWSLYMTGLLGCGGQSLHAHRKFHGYGPIHHKSLDLTLCYTQFLDASAFFRLQYAFRLYAYNFPRNLHSFSLAFSYPFGL